MMCGASDRALSTVSTGAITASNTKGRKGSFVRDVSAVVGAHAHVIYGTQLPHRFNLLGIQAI